MKDKQERLEEIIDLMYHLNGPDTVYVNNKDELNWRIKMIKRESKAETIKNVDHHCETYIFHIHFHKSIDFETFEKAVKKFDRTDRSYVSFLEDNKVMVTFDKYDILEPNLKVEEKVISFRYHRKYYALYQIRDYLKIVK